MNNCLVLGCGRSGTSMLGGILHQAGYFMGDALYSPLPGSNPKGFYECKEINGINETILSGCRIDSWTKVVKRITGKSSIHAPGRNQHWLLALPTGRSLPAADPPLIERMQKMLARTPFAYKDPRFSYTLPLWWDHLPQSTRFLCIFRNPGATVTSILKECRSRNYLADFHIRSGGAFRVWHSMYSRIVEYRRQAPERFFFVHYDQILDGRSLPSLSDFLNADLNGGFAEKKFNHNPSARRLPRQVGTLYRHLCKLSGCLPASEQDGSLST